MIFSALMVILSKNPVHSILFLVLVFFGTVGILLLFEIEFLAFIILIIYVGAIAVLFLFVVMMLNLKIIELNNFLLRYLPIGSIISFLFFLEIFFFIKKNFLIVNWFIELKLIFDIEYINWLTLLNITNNLTVLSQIIYTNYFIVLILASLILLVAMIGSIILTLEKQKTLKSQNINKQIKQNFLKNLKLKTW